MENFTFKRSLMFLVCLLLGCLAIHATADGLITEQVTIKLSEAGTLPNKIGKNKKYKITNLKIVGEINGTDIRLIRDMAGSDERGNYTEGKLTTLDLSEVKIVSGGDHNFSCRSDYECSVDNSISNSMFAKCSHLISISLPLSVTAIGDDAFFCCFDLIDIKIPSKVSSIGECAFIGCSNLPSINLPASLTTIGYSAFKACSSLTSIYLSMEKPIELDDYGFEDVVLNKCTLYVPQGSFLDYWLADGWGDFSNIVEYDPTGIDKITTSNSGEAKEISRYGADGQRLDAPAKGLNIVKYSDGSVKKVVVQ